MESLYRIIPLVIKELQALLRDRQGRLLLIVPVVMQLIIFSTAATLEVKNNTLAVYDLDGGTESFELQQRLARAEAFTRILHVRTETELREVIEGQQALLAIRFAPDFTRSVLAGHPVNLQVVLDGRRSNSGQIALGYVRRILQGYLADRKLVPTQVTAGEMVVRHWFNPNLDYVRHIIPSLVAIITTVSTMVVTSLSVAREREQGTFDQLLVSPLTPGMIMIGKVVPALFAATAQGTIIALAGVFIFGIPFEGSPVLLYGSMVLYILALAGFGLLISSICSTQQQAFLGVFSFIMPAILLSGFPAPVENMPLWLQRIDWFNPIQHFIVIVKGVFLKDITAAELTSSIWPLVVITFLTFTGANWSFRRRIG